MRCWRTTSFWNYINIESFTVYLNSTVEFISFLIDNMNTWNIYFISWIINRVKWLTFESSTVEVEHDIHNFTLETIIEITLLICDSFFDNFNNTKIDSKTNCLKNKNPSFLFKWKFSTLYFQKLNFIICDSKCSINFFCFTLLESHDSYENYLTLIDEQ
jgi:hypothetical protein